MRNPYFCHSSKACAALLLALLALRPSYSADSPAFDVPQIADIKIDGKADDWGDKGLKVETICDVAGRCRPPKDFNVNFRLGWNEKGLLVLVDVTDDVALEPAEKPEDMWQGDSIEFFVATARGADKSYQVVVAPGRDKKKPELRSNISDYRKGEGKKEKLTIEAQRTVSDTGYILEVLLPWKNLNIEAKEGTELAFQLYANDADKENERFQALWYPKPDAHSDTNNTHRLRLAGEKSTGKIQAAAAGSYDGDGKAQLAINGVVSLAGKTVQIKEGDKTLGEGTFIHLDGRASAKISLPKPEKPYGPLNAVVDGATISTVIIPEPPK